MLRALMKRVENMQEQTGNVKIEVGILRKIHKEILEIKNNVTEAKNIFYGFISRLDMAG